MSINLNKRAEKVGIILAKRGLTKIPPVRVGVALDVSGSTESMYSHGVIQETFDRLLAVSLKFDDNGELDTWAFSNQSTQLETASADDEGTFITEQVINNTGIKGKWGGTNYAPCWSAVVEFYFPSKVAEAAKSIFSGMKSLFGGAKPAASAASTLPAMLLFVTDGDNQDKTPSRTFMETASANPKMYFHMVGVGAAHQFGFLEELADKYDNVGFVNLASLSISDDQLYEKLITQEVVEWVKKAAA